MKDKHARAERAERFRVFQLETLRSLDLGPKCPRSEVSGNLQQQAIRPIHVLYICLFTSKQAEAWQMQHQRRCVYVSRDFNWEQVSCRVWIALSVHSEPRVDASALTAASKTR